MQVVIDILMIILCICNTLMTLDAIRSFKKENYKRCEFNFRLVIVMLLNIIAFK